jgi:predicted deacylase
MSVAGQDALIIGGQTVAPGTRSMVRIPVTTGLNGAELALSVHVVRGREDGPSLTMLSGLHGGEWFTIETLRRLVMGTDPAT